jgi:hypothetical protein
LIRFWSKVEKTETCWLWKSCITKQGYGKFRFQNKFITPHRFAYELIKGKIPKDKEIDHLCRNRKCCNPEHLEAVTHRENIRRGECGKHNKLKTHCPRGHEYNEENTYLNNQNRVCKKCYILFKRGPRK